MGGDGRIRSPGECRLGEPDVVTVDIFFAREGDGRRLEIRTLYEADSGTHADKLLEVGGASIERSLEDDTDVASLREELPEDVERSVSVGGAFHVDSNKVLELRRCLHHARNVVTRRGLVEVKAKLREFYGNVAFHADIGNPAQAGDRAVRGFLRVSQTGHVFSQVIERRSHAASIDGLHGGERFLQRFARHEPASDGLGQGIGRCDSPQVRLLR